MKEIIINGINYEVIKDNKGIEHEALVSRMTDYFEAFDYVVGDWAYGKLRLKGFYDSTNKKCQTMNDIALLDDYIKNKCAYGCRWFQIKKIDKKTK